MQGAQAALPQQKPPTQLPDWHSQPRLQLTPFVSLVTQLPLLQTLFVPHGVPPTKFVQLPQAPLKHSMSVAHIVPSAEFPVAMQVDAPVEQVVMPVLHVPGMHVVPAVHDTHVPEPLHT